MRHMVALSSSIADAVCLIRMGSQFRPTKSQCAKTNYMTNDCDVLKLSDTADSSMWSFKPSTVVRFSTLCNQAVC
eukprot:3011217-Amphidinium_carterae.1